MHVAIPSFGLGSTGGDRMLTVIANALVKRGHKVTIINLGSAPIFYSLSPRVKFITVPFKTSKKDLKKFVINGIEKLADNLPPADIYLANWVFTVLPCIANIGRGTTVFLAQANEAYTFKQSSLKFLSYLSFQAFASRVKLITPSQYLRTLFKNRFNISAAVIPPCVDTSVFFPKKKVRPMLNTQPLRLLFVGNVMNRNKGFDILIKACQGLRDINFELHVTTQGPVPPVRRCTIVVHKPSSDKELAALYRKCDVFFHLSKEEGFGLTLLEAMASGLVCVATDSGGVRDFVRDGKNCFVVERTVKALRHAIKKAAAIPYEKRDIVSAAAITTAHRYTEKKFIDNIEKELSTINKKRKNLI